MGGCFCSFKMAGERVVSKNLFNFGLKGQIDSDILGNEKKISEESGGKEVDLDPTKLASLSYEDMRAVINGRRETFERTCQVMTEFFTDSIDNCNQSNLKVPTHHDGKFDVDVLIHTPKTMLEETKRPCIIYAHGGGAVVGSANGYKGFLSDMAVECEVIVFNVDYRLAPETRCPNNVLDFYEVVKYVANHANQLEVDTSRICIAGESGGGYICSGTMVHLATQGESGLVKLAIPIIPMLTDYSFTDPRSMTIAEAENAALQQTIWRLVAGPQFEEMREDPMLFPGKVDRDLLIQMPPTIIWEAEFDIYITEARRFADRLNEVGRLLELVVIPGAKHGSGMMPQNACFHFEREAWTLAIQEYLIK